MSKFESGLIEKSTENIKSAGLSPGDKVIIGVSGGADSMALLHLAAQLQLNAFVVHVNYGKRGSESDRDQQLVEGFSAEAGYVCRSFIVKSNVTGQNFQNWAREKRYQIFRELKQQESAAAILTAHHRDDQLETILQKLFRGSGIAAWQGMRVWDGELLRPFLNSTKDEIYEYCRQNKIPYRIDASNLESDFARNYIRNEFAPKLDGFFPGWRTNILDLPAKAEVAEQSLKILLEQITDGPVLYLKDFLKWPESLQSALLISFAKKLNLNLSKGELEEIIKLSRLDTGKKIILDENAEIVKNRDELVFKTESAATGFELYLHEEDLKKGITAKHLKIRLQEHIPEELHLRLDAQNIAWPLILRRWQPGDFLQPLGMSGHQKLSDHLTNQKISSVLKDETLVLSSKHGTIYAVIFPEKKVQKRLGTIAESAKCTPNTLEYLIITSKP